MKTGSVADLPAPEEVRAAMADFIALVHQRTDAAQRIVVYGSAARGDYGPDSDVDVLVEWRGDIHEAWALLALISEELLGRHRVMITAFPVASAQGKSLAEVGALFWREVQAHGLVVA